MHFLKYTLSPSLFATWLSVYVVVATSSWSCDFSHVHVSSIRLLECYWCSFVLSSAPRRTSSEFITSSLASCIDWSMPVNTLGVPYSAHSLSRNVRTIPVSRLRACRLLDIIRIFAICCPLRGARVSFQFARLRSPRWRTRSSAWFFLWERSRCKSKDSSVSGPESRTIKSAESYSTNPSTLPGSSSFVVHHAENGACLTARSVEFDATNEIH